ncbi:MAG: Branched-chain amino acid transport system substrate-binding protein [Candidatus Taylorbacteria bacterium]|nr:Branched-chain amino acid transport system substrate-binding protein [Candidatus Taylorbacteria bacterium]
MNKYIKIIVGIAVVVFVLAFAVFSKDSNSPAETASAKPTIKIGVTLPLTGDVASLGEANKNAIVLASEQLKSRNLKYSYEFVFEDDQFKPAIGATAASKLISVDNSDAIISFGSPVGNVVSPIAEQSKILHVNDFASDPKVANGSYNFVHYTPAKSDAIAFVNELNTRGIKKIVFFAQADNPGAAAIVNAIREKAAGTDIKILSTETFLTGTRDFRTNIDKVKNLGAELYVLQASSPEIEILTRQLRASGIKAPVGSVETFEFSNDLSLFEGLWYVNAADATSWFNDLYTKRYGVSPKIGAPNAYDAVNMIVQAVETAGDGKTKPSRTEIRNAFASIQGFNGALGNNLNVGKDGLVDSKAVIRIIKGGKPVTVSESK